MLHYTEQFQKFPATSFNDVKNISYCKSAVSGRAFPSIHCPHLQDEVVEDDSSSSSVKEDV